MIQVLVLWFKQTGVSVVYKAAVTLYVLAIISQMSISCTIIESLP